MKSSLPGALFQRVADWLRLLRAGNCAVVSLGAYTGYVAGRGGSLPQGVLVAVSAALVAAWGNIVNDYFDLESDAISKPWRPLPSRRISPGSAVSASLLLLAAGLALGFLVSPLCGFTAVLASALLFLYSWRVKALGLPGNVLIAFLAALNVVYGALASPEPWRSLLPSAYAFLIILGREVLKGVEDLEGDAARGVKTVASTLGARAALRVSAVLLLAVVALSPLPLLSGYGALYALFAFGGVDAPIALALLKAGPEPRRAWIATRILKVPLLMGLLAFLVGGLA